MLWSGSGGNPKLKPYIAVGTDLSYEFYFGKSSYFAAAVFNKNLLNYIYNQTTLDYTSRTTPTTTPRSRRPAPSARSRGRRTAPAARCRAWSVRRAGRRAARRLDGFGVQANFSLTNSNIPVSSISSIPGGPATLPGLSRKVANLALYYEKYGWSVRAAERYRSSFTGEAVALFDQLGYTKVLANKQTDLQLGYAFSEGRWNGLSLLLQVSNLTNTPATRSTRWPAD